jgi:hypothetical protein
MLKTVQILLIFVAYFDYEIQQMDVKSAFLNENLTKDVYITQPKDFVDSKIVGKMCNFKNPSMD